VAHSAGEQIAAHALQPPGAAVLHTSFVGAHETQAFGQLTVHTRRFLSESKAGRLGLTCETAGQESSHAVSIDIDHVEARI
jgi:hypothetical protein